ncbi:hypothetical protein JCM10212_002220 [Sporobolomyces blumeae]
MSNRPSPLPRPTDSLSPPRLHAQPVLPRLASGAAPHSPRLVGIQPTYGYPRPATTPFADTYEAQPALPVASSSSSSAPSQPISLVPSTSAPFPSLDSNSFDTYQDFAGLDRLYDAATPSYCGSWTSDLSAPSPSAYSTSTSSAFVVSPPPPPPASLPFENSDQQVPSVFDQLYAQAQAKTQQLSLEQSPDEQDMAPFDSTAFDDGPLATRVHSNPQRELNQPERDFTLTMPKRGGPPTTSAAPSQRPYAYTRSSSGFGSFLNYANSPTTERARPATPAYSATRSTVFDAGPVSDSPPASTGSFFPSSDAPMASASSGNAPTLTKLEIPNTPSVALTGPTPETAKPRPKGRGTLELERVLGLWAAKTPTSSFPNLPPLPSNGSAPASSASAPTEPLFAQAIVSSEPESFVPSTTTSSVSAPPEDTSTANTSYSSVTSAFPEFPAPQVQAKERGSRDSLAPPLFPPRRRRSKSDTDVMRLDSLGYPHSNLPVGPFVDPPPIVSNQPTFASSVAPPSPVNGNGEFQQQLAMNPSDSWRSPPPPSAATLSTSPLAALDLNDQSQRDLSSRSRAQHTHARGGGPGYPEAGFLDVPLDGTSRLRRSRSQGAGHRSSKSDDLSHLLPSLPYPQAPVASQPAVVNTSADGLLAPPNPGRSPIPSHSPPVQSMSPYPQQVASPYPTQAASLYPQQQQQQQQQRQQQHSPYLQHQQQPGFGQSPIQSYPQQQQQQSAANGYLSNQAALLASAALIAFNPSDPAHAAAAAAGYLPPPYAQNTGYASLGYAGAFGSSPPVGLPPLPPHHQQPSTQATYASDSTRASTATSIVRDVPPASYGSATAGPDVSTAAAYLSTGGGPATHPRTAAYLYHSPALGALPSPPNTNGRSVSPARSSGTSTRGRVKRKQPARKGVKVEEDEDELMNEANLDGPGNEDEDADGDDGDDADEDEDADAHGDEDGEESVSSPAGAGTKKAKKKARGGANAAAKARAKRQMSEDAFSERSKTTQATIDAAKRRRNANAVAKFVCELCGETFTRRYNLRGHQRAHNGEKPYKCSYEGCDKAFARAHDCKRHELLHLGVRKYHCSPCKRDFVRLDALHRHHRSEVGQACVRQLEAEGYVFDDRGAVGL